MYNKYQKEMILIVDNVIKLAPIAISVASLIISIISVYIKLPRLKIGISNKKIDAFYGATEVKEENGLQYLSRYVAGVMFRVYNQSSASVALAEISLVYKGETYSIAQRINDYWDTIEFFFVNDGNEITTDGSAFSYKETGITCPYILNSYETKDVLAIFPSFPKMNKKRVNAVLYLDTAVGKKKKSIKLKIYNSTYSDAEWQEVQKYNRSL